MLSPPDLIQVDVCVHTRESLSVLHLHPMGLGCKSHYDTSEHVSRRPVLSFDAACVSPHRIERVSAAKRSCGSVSLSRYHFSWWELR